MGAVAGPVAAVRTRRTTRLIIPGVALLILAMGVATWDPSYPRWGALGVALYAVPLACCAFRSVTIRVWGFAFGIFMVVQSVASVLLPSLPNDYVTLPHRMRLAIDVEASNIPGISGIQNVTTDEQDPGNAWDVAGLHVDRQTHPMWQRHVVVRQRWQQHGSHALHHHEDAERESPDSNRDGAESA